MPRKRSTKPYVNGPYFREGHGKKPWRLHVFPGDRTRTAGGGSRRRILRPAFETREAALVWKREYLRRTASEGRSVGDAVNDFHADARRRGNKPGTITTSGYNLARLLDYDQELADLTPANAQRLYDELVDDTLESEGAVATQRRSLAEAKTFGKFIVARGWARVNPFENVAGVGRLSRGKEQFRMDEARAFTAHCLRAWAEKKDRAAIAAIAPLYMTMRAGEVAGLRAIDVDDNGRLLWIAERDGKSKAARRRFLIPKFLRAAFLELAATPATPEGDLFAKEDGEAANRHWVARHAQRHMAAAGVRVLTTHGLRGLHSTLASIEGHTGESVARAMGHENPALTKSTYIDAERAEEAALERFEAAIAGVDVDVAAPRQPSPQHDDRDVDASAPSSDRGSEGGDH